MSALIFAPTYTNFFPVPLPPFTEGFSLRNGYLLFQKINNYIAIFFSWLSFSYLRFFFFVLVKIIEFFNCEKSS